MAPLCLLSDPDRDYRLLVYFVERLCLIFYPGKIDLTEIDATDGAIVHGTIVDHAVRHVGCRGPLRGTWNINRSLIGSELYSDGYVKIIQYLETLDSGLLSCFLPWCGRLIESGTDKSGRRGDVAWYTKKTTSVSERCKSHSVQLLGGGHTGNQIDIVIQVCHLPVETWGVGQYT